MALNRALIERLLDTESADVAPYMNVSRSVIDGLVVVYDLDDYPTWLQDVLDRCDEDGETHGPRTAEKF